MSNGQDVIISTKMVWDQGMDSKSLLENYLNFYHTFYKIRINCDILQTITLSLILPLVMNLEMLVIRNRRLAYLCSF